MRSKTSIKILYERIDILDDEKKININYRSNKHIIGKILSEYLRHSEQYYSNYTKTYYLHPNPKHRYRKFHIYSCTYSPIFRIKFNRFNNVPPNFSHCAFHSFHCTNELYKNTYRSIIKFIYTFMYETDRFYVNIVYEI